MFYYLVANQTDKGEKKTDFQELKYINGNRHQGGGPP